MGLRSGSHGDRQHSRRHSRPFLGSFDEPEPAGNASLNLRTTGQSLDEFPDENALEQLVDPARAQRQQSRVAPKVTRRNPRSAADAEFGNLGDAKPNGAASEEKLFLRLKRKLATDPRTPYSDLRETPVKGEEDYRHNRADAATLAPGKGGSTKRRRFSNPQADAALSLQMPSRRARRSTRPAVYEYEASLDTSQDQPANEASKKGSNGEDKDDDDDDDDEETLVKGGSDSEDDASYDNDHKRSANGSRAKTHSKSRGNGASTSAPGPTGTETGKNIKVEPQGATYLPPADASAKIVASAAAKSTSPSTGATESTGKAKGVVNNDYCNACGGTGELLCCETCVRSFHFSCIEPPVMTVEEISEEEWSCRHCKPLRLSEEAKQNISKTLFAPLITSLESHNAVAFQLPTNLRELFAHVQTSKYGEYMDEYMKTDHLAPGPRLQDKNGNTILCFKCHSLARSGKEMAICSQCQEAWHIDCVNPPLESTPLGYWICPLHASNVNELPLRVKKPIMRSVGLKRKVPNNGDIEIEDDDVEEDSNENILAEQHEGNLFSNDREYAGSFSDEEVTRTVTFPAQTSVLSNGSLVAKSSRLRSRNADSDRVVFKLPTKTIKLDFLEAVHDLRGDPYRETPTTDFMMALDCLADRPQPEVDAIRNLMHLKLQGPAVSTASAKENLNTLLDAALNDENEIGQLVAIRKLMQEKGRERLLHVLSTC